MTKDITIVIPFAFNPVFLQTCVASFKANTDLGRADIIVVDNFEDINRQGKDVRVLTETSLGEGVRIFKQNLRLDENRAYATHASALNYSIPFIDTPYLFTTESDVTANRKDWLDWYFSFIDDKNIAMVGWLWPARLYINPSQTLFKMDILRKIEAEVRDNKSTDIKWADDFNRERTHHENHWRNLIERGLIGPFNEMRGFAKNPLTGELERDFVRDDHDTGSWLYYRLKEEYPCRAVPGVEIAIPDWQQQRCAPTKYQYIGDSEEQAYLYHHSAGTVAHDYEKHIITVEWQSYCMEWWLRREYRLWEEIVPEFIRKETLAKGLILPMEQEIEKALKRVHIIHIGDEVRAYHGEVSSFIDGSKPETRVSGDGLNATVVGHEPFEDLCIVELKEEPSRKLPYYKQRQEGGKWLFNAHPQWLVKRKGSYYGEGKVTMQIKRVQQERILERCISDDMVCQYMGSAAFGPAGADVLRGSDYRTIGAGWLLYGFVRAMRPKIIVEIGCGGTTLCMLWALRHNQLYPERQGHIHGIDPFEWGDLVEQNGETHTTSYWDFIDKLKELEMEDLITFYNEKSQVKGLDWNMPIDMLVVDGDHDAEAVKKDWEYFSKHIVPGGYAFFHDAIAIPDQIGVMLEEACRNSNDFNFMLEPDHLSYAIIQRKFSINNEAVLETRHHATLPDVNETPIHLTNARDVGVVIPYKGSYFTTAEEWQMNSEEFWQRKSKL